MKIIRLRRPLNTNEQLCLARFVEFEQYSRDELVAEHVRCTQHYVQINNLESANCIVIELIIGPAVAG